MVGCPYNVLLSEKKHNGQPTSDWGLARELQSTPFPAELAKQRLATCPAGRAAYLSGAARNIGVVSSGTAEHLRSGDLDETGDEMVWMGSNFR
jgi:hypothetical protein